MDEWLKECADSEILVHGRRMDNRLDRDVDTFLTSVLDYGVCEESLLGVAFDAEEIWRVLGVHLVDLGVDLLGSTAFCPAVEDELAVCCVCSYDYDSGTGFEALSIFFAASRIKKGCFEDYMVFMQRGH